MPLEGLKLGHYQLIRLIGSGGMGEVYLGSDTRVSRQVAIKVIRAEATPYPDREATKEAARLFQREVKAIVALDHPHILPLIDFGEESINNATLTYIVMPFRQEGSLTDWLQRRNSTEMLSLQDVAHLIDQAADALQHAHDHQLIHQDVKPSNFLVRSRLENAGCPDLLLADFGIAKFNNATATTSHTVRGTPVYMAPEQWDGRPVPATDQYALAIMAYQLLTGHPPFQGGPGQIMRQHFDAQPEPPSTLNPRIPTTIDAVILRALEKKSEDRFASIAAFAQDFQVALQSAETLSTPRGTDIRVTLSISKTEAQAGTNRTLTLSGGRRVHMSVPPNAYDGQIIRLEGLGESYDGGPRGTVILTIRIAQVEETASLFKSQRDISTFVSGPKPLPTLSINTEATSNRRKLFTGKTILLVGLMLLILVSGTGLFYTTHASHLNTNTPNTPITSYNTTAGTQVNPTPTQQVNPTPTQQVNPTPTQQVNPTPTQQQVNPTPTQQVNPTPTQQVNPTPTQQVNPTPTSTPTQQPTPTPTSGPLGGTWIGPGDNFVVASGTSLHFSAQAYGGVGGVNHVNFTITVSGQNAWFVGCQAFSPTPGTTDVYECNWNLTDGNGNPMPPGAIQVSFDVYDQVHNRILSANGFRNGSIT